MFPQNLLVSYLNSSGSITFVTNKSTRTAVNIGATTTVAKAVNNLQDKIKKNNIFYLKKNLYDDAVLIIIHLNKINGLGSFLFLLSFLCYRPRTKYEGKYCFHRCLRQSVCSHLRVGGGGGTHPRSGQRGYPIPRSGVSIPGLDGRAGYPIPDPAGEGLPHSRSG